MVKRLVKNGKFKESVYSLIFSIPIIGSGTQELDISYHPDNEKAVANLAKKLFKVGDFKVKRDGKTIMAGEGGEITQPHKIDQAMKPETKAPKNKYGVNVEMPFPVGDIKASGGFRLEPEDEKNLADLMGKMSKKFGRPVTVKKGAKTIIAADGEEITTPYSYVPSKGKKVLAVKGEEPAEPEAPEEPEPEPVNMELPKQKAVASKGEEGDRVSFSSEKEGEVHGLVVQEEDERGRVKILKDDGSTAYAMGSKISKSKKPLSDKGKAVQKKAKGGILKKIGKVMSKTPEKGKKYIKRFKKGGVWKYIYPKEYYYGRGDKFRRNADCLNTRRRNPTPSSMSNFDFKAEMIRRER